ncbi:MAG: winged helix-turn-helix transcriptional regulator [Chloroflexi bacterium]|nr:winged helix-turn-helix transcriptional regulator [Chloroflexota bacterium]
MDEFSQGVYLLHAQILKVLANPKRLMILDCLHSGEMSVGELAERLGLPQANVSQHLAALRAQLVVGTRREGNTVRYSLSDPRIVQACDIFHQFLADRMRSSQALANRFPEFRPLREEGLMGRRNAGGAR